MFKIKKISSRGKYTKFPMWNIPQITFQDNDIYGGYSVQYYTMSEKTPDGRKTIITTYAEVHFNAKTVIEFDKETPVLSRIYRWKGYWEFVKFLDY